jgi:hypothetical protein
MRSISELLLKYPLPGVRESEIRRICIEEVLALTGCTLLSSQVQYQNEELRFSVPPVLKSALLIRKEELLGRIQGREVAIRRLK